MTEQLNTDSNVAGNTATTTETVAEIVKAASDLRGSMSEQDQRSVCKTLITVIVTYAAARFNLLDTETQSQLMSEYWGELSFIGSIPGVQAAYALWRKDRG